jgi:nicotinamidase-related amidase
MIAPERTALVVVDVQVDFAAPHGVVAGYGADMTDPTRRWTASRNWSRPRGRPG